MKYDILKGKMREKRITQSEMAKMLNVDVSTLNRKLNDVNAEFSIKEAKIIVEKLQLTSEQATAIFFNQTVA